MDVTLSHYRAENKNATPHLTNQDNPSYTSGFQDGNPYQDSTDSKDSKAKMTADFDANTKALIEDKQEIRARKTEDPQLPLKSVAQSTPVPQKNASSKKREV